MDKKESKKLFKVVGKSKKMKDHMKFKKRMKKVLEYENLGEAVYDADIMDVDYSSEVEKYTSAFLPSDCVQMDSIKGGKCKPKTKKNHLSGENATFPNKYIQAKDTPAEENVMINVISGIISNTNISTTLHSDVPKSTSNHPGEKLQTKKLTSKLETKIEKKLKADQCSIKEHSNINIKPECESLIFDPNQSLAQKIIKKIKNNCSVSKTNSLSPAVLKRQLNNSLYNDIFRSHKLKKPKRKLIKGSSYKTSVLEVFHQCNPSKEASISSVNFDMESSSSQNANHSHLKPVNDDQISQEDDDSTCGILDESTDDNLREESVISSENKNISPSIQPKTYKLFVFWKFCIVILKSNTKLYFCGKLKASSLHGSIEILGAELTNTREIYSLPNYSLLCFESYLGCKARFKVTALTDLGIPISKAEEIMKEIGPDDSLLLLQPHNNTMTDFVSKHFSSADIFSKEKLDNYSSNTEIFKLLQCHFITELRRGLFASYNDWTNISRTVLHNKKSQEKHNVTIICGGKNSGKSTFLRYLVNKTLSDGPVVVIDLDPGQPEFTISGLISVTLVKEPLLGPNFTHIMEPDRSICLGLINVADNDRRYIKCVQDIFEYCKNKETYSSIPWIVNTMGFTGQLGLKLLTAIINIFEPSLLVELKSNVPRNNFDFGLYSMNVSTYQKGCQFEDKIQLHQHSYIYYSLDPFQKYWNNGKSSLFRPLIPKVERLLNALAYFSQTIMGRSLSILEMVPYVIPIDDISIAFNNIYVEYSYAPSVLNGKMVALCKDKRFDTQQHPKDTIFGVDLAYCYGYGIVRGIDMVSRKVYIITPVKPRDISHVNTLVYGESNPNCKDMLISSLPRGTAVPYMTPKLNIGEHSYLMTPAKRNFNPFRLLKNRV